MHTKYIIYGNRQEEEKLSYFYVPSFLFQITTFISYSLSGKVIMNHVCPKCAGDEKKMYRLIRKNDGMLDRMDGVARA